MFQPDTNNESVPNANGPQEPMPNTYAPWQAPAPGNANSWQASTPHDEATVPFSHGTAQPANAPQPQPQYATVPPVNNRPPTRRGGVSRAVLLTMLCALLFGALVFGAGWEFGRGSAATTAGVGALQSGSSSSSSQTTVPALSSNNIQTVQEAVVAKVSPAVVQVNVTTASGAAIGSGVIIDKRGYIVTNNHVVSGARSIQVVLSSGMKETAQLTGTDPNDDLAIIKINPPASMAVASLGNSSALTVGQDVLAIGNPLGITQTVTNGIVSALNRNVSEGQNGVTLPGTIQTDAPINPGNSGGALVDLSGNLIGIPTLTAIDPEFNAPASGVGFAIPVNRVKLIAPQIIATGHVTHTGRAELGIQATDVTPQVAAQNNLSVNQGVLVVSLVSGGPAAKAGLQPGDVIVQVGNTATPDLSTLGDVLASANVGATVPVKVYRGNQQLTINVTLGELPAGA